VSRSRPTPPIVCQCFLLLILLFLLLGNGDPAQASASGANSSVRDIVRNIEPAIVWVVAELDAGDFSQGTGVIIREDGYILTNAHVVEGSTSITIGWPDRFDRSQLAAEVAAFDPDLDLALLHVSGAHLPTIPVNPLAPPCVGDALITMGYPAGEQLGLDNLTVTRGLLSSIRVDSEAGDRVYQTDATVTLGCSGGPLYDLDTGAVIGIIQGKGVSMLEGFNFAIPIDRLFAFAGTSPADGVGPAVTELAGISEPDDSDPVARSLESYNLGLAAQEQSLWAEALSHFLVASQLENEDPQTAYGVAESYAALDQPRQALRWLERAFELGYSDFDNALESPGFSEVRDDERFVDLVRSF
jgi:S1-C subfamily serine protease